ncbi:uncharacterized protein LOC119102439 [Pollicipes pollicipes]|uniref:uncharacterized protein LOC119102439 n=1 Tax=Pollicipes pollicipes TaxID=41117 RepID=UPI001884FE4B|nr:uncharacterized protein LOC119102439 [Pollicipes pollicipes]
MWCSHLSNKTAEDRVLEYGAELFRSSGELLLCQFCDKPVDPRRRSSIEYHLKSFSHQRKWRPMEVVPILHASRPAYQVAQVPARRRRRGRRRPVAVDSADPRGRSHLSNKTAEDRVLEYGAELFRSSGELLLCQFCDKPVDPRRRSSIEYHLKSFSHQRKVRSLTGEAGSPGSGSDSPAAGDEPQPLLLEPGAAMKLDPTSTDSPLRHPDWGALFNGHGPAALSQMSLLMAEGVASSLCEAQLAEGRSSPVVNGSTDSERHCCCHCACAQRQGNTFPNELVLKVRVADSPSRHFVLVDLPTSDLTWLRLLSVSCAALGVPVKMVKEVLKLPNTLLVRDKDVRRLLDYQELELIMHNG